MGEAGVEGGEYCLKLATTLLNTVFKAPKFFLHSFPLWLYYSLLTFRLICYHLHFGGGWLSSISCLFDFNLHIANFILCDVQVYLWGFDKCKEQLRYRIILSQKCPEASSLRSAPPCTLSPSDH